MLRFLVGGCNEGTTPLFSDLISALYEVHHGLKPGRLPYNDTDQVVVMLRGGEATILKYLVCPSPRELNPIFPIAEVCVLPLS